MNLGPKDFIVGATLCVVLEHVIFTKWWDFQIDKFLEQLISCQLFEYAVAVGCILVYITYNIY
jgi:hypothetical protein